jgi:hypothetical protein
MRVLNGPKVWLYHAATQSLGLLLAVIGAGMGIWIAMTTDQVTDSPAPDNRHYVLTIPPAQHSPRNHRPPALRFNLADRFRRLAAALGFPQVQAQNRYRTCPHVGCARYSHSRFR